MDFTDCDGNQPENDQNNTENWLFCGALYESDVTLGDMQCVDFWSLLKLLK